MLKIKPLVKNLKLPTKAHDGDAGWDLYSRERALILPGEFIKFKMGFAIIGEPGMAYIVHGKSGLSQYGINTIGNVIDSGYRGEISVTLINHGDVDMWFMEGEKVAQLLIHSIDTGNKLEVDESPIEETDRGDNAYGSSGKT